jgi:hypothetical protein
MHLCTYAPIHLCTYAPQAGLATDARLCIVSGLLGSNSNRILPPGQRWLSLTLVLYCFGDSRLSSSRRCRAPAAWQQHAQHVRQLEHLRTAPHCASLPQITERSPGTEMMGSGVWGCTPHHRHHICHRVATTSTACQAEQSTALVHICAWCVCACTMSSAVSPDGGCSARIGSAVQCT